MTCDRYYSELHRMLELPMASLLSIQSPPVRFNQFDDFAHRHADAPFRNDIPTALEL
jgi:hypothetical protein